MKKVILFAYAAVSSASMLFGMEEAAQIAAAKGSLSFLVNKNHLITKCLAVNMAFAIPESEFIGKDMRDVIKLQGSGNEEVAKAFKVARKERTITSVGYIFDGKSYVAEITPVFNDQKKGRVNYFVKVTG